MLRNVQSQSRNVSKTKAENFIFVSSCHFPGSIIFAALWRRKVYVDSGNLLAAFHCSAEPAARDRLAFDDDINNNDVVSWLASVARRRRDCQPRHSRDNDVQSLRVHVPTVALPWVKNWGLETTTCLWDS